MANGGRQLTPFDTIDLGGQLLQALVAAQQTKGERERQKLQEKQFALDEKQLQLQGLQLADPQQAGFGDILSSLVGAPVQPNVPIEQQRFLEERQLIAGLSPEEKSTFDRMRLTGSPLSIADQVDVAKITGGIKPNFGQRADVFSRLLESIGSPILPAFNAAVGKDLGVRLPTGTKTIGEQQLGISKTLAEAQTKEAEARRQVAKTEFMEFMTGGFSKASDQVSDGQFRAAMQEVFEVASDQRLFLSPEASAALIPTSKLAAIAKAAGEPPPGFTQDLEVLKVLIDVASLGKKPSPESLTFLTTKTQEFLNKYPMMQSTVGLPTAEGEGVALPGPLSVALNLATGETGGITLSGRPLKPEIAKALSLALRAGGKLVPVLRDVQALEGSLKTLQSAYQKILPLITTETGKPPKLAPTLGALSSPEAVSIPPEAKQQLQGLVQAYRAAGGTPEEAAAIEQDIATVFLQGDEAQIKTAIEALSEMIEEKKVESRLMPKR